VHRAITLWPEWAWAVCYLGKNVENRPWKPPIPAGSHLAIHAGKNPGGTGRLGEAMGSIKLLVEAAMRAGWTGTAKMIADKPGHADIEIDFRRYEPGSLIETEATLKLSEITRGAVVAMAELGHFTSPAALNSPWAAGGPMWAWPLQDVLVLKQPIPCRGAQRLWFLPPAVESELRVQLADDEGGIDA